MKIAVDGFPGEVYIESLTPEPGLSRRENEEKAVGRLVEEIFGTGATRFHTPEGAPLIADCHGNEIAVAVTISHSRHYAAIATAPPGCRAGIDIEEQRDQIGRVAPRVLSAEELAHYSALPDGLLRAWTLKEALFKAARPVAGPQLEFATQLQLPLENTDARVIRADGTLLSIFNTHYHKPDSRTALSLVWQKS